MLVNLSQTIQKKQEPEIFSMKAATLNSTIWGNMLAGKSKTLGRGVIEAGNGAIRFGEGTAKAGQNF